MPRALPKRIHLSLTRQLRPKSARRFAAGPMRRAEAEGHCPREQLRFPSPVRLRPPVRGRWHTSSAFTRAPLPTAATGIWFQCGLECEPSLISGRLAPEITTGRPGVHSLFQVLLLSHNPMSGMM